MGHCEIIQGEVGCEMNKMTRKTSGVEPEMQWVGVMEVRELDRVERVSPK